jgi:hypothetical protein
VDDENGGLVEAMKSQAASIRSVGYEGPLTAAVMRGASQCYVLHLLSFKNMQSRLEVQQAIGGIRYVLCRPVSSSLCTHCARCSIPKRAIFFPLCKSLGKGADIGSMPRGMGLGDTVASLMASILTQVFVHFAMW